MRGCPRESDLEAFVSGSGEVLPHAAVEDHVAKCGLCRTWVDEARRDEEFLRSLRKYRSSSSLGSEDHRPSDAAARSLHTDEIAFDLPFTLGDYRIIRRIGEGGMGAVFEAEQDRPARRVALKILRSGLPSQRARRRFEHEAELLGRLQHPGIAQIFEAGVAQTSRGSLPYLAMELITGERVTDFAARNRLGTRERLALLADVAEAIQHAHLRGVVHRDLKPANILIDESRRARILDFGIARATDLDTRTSLRTDIGQLVGTLPYMSPEQVIGDSDSIDARSDVYSLGVVAYELLAGRLPHDLRGRSLVDAARTIREEEPASLSSVNATLSGDVDTLVAKALERDPARRYQSAIAFADDIRRYLRNEPIVARPASAAYQLRKFAARNRALVAGAAATIGALALGAAGSLWFALAARQARDEALRESDRAQQAESRALDAAEQARIEAIKSTRVQAFLTEMLQSPDPARAGPRITVRELLDAAAPRARAEFADTPDLRAAVLDTLGGTYESLGAFDAAEPLFREALETRRQLFGDASEHTIASTTHLASTLASLGRSDEADPLVTGAATLATEHLGRTHTLTLDVLNDMAWLRDYQGRAVEAEALYREIAAAKETTLGPDAPSTLKSLHNVAVILHTHSRPAEAEPILRRCYYSSRSARGEKHPDTISFQMSLGILEYKLNRLPEALALIDAALPLFREVFGDEHKRTADCAGVLAVLKLESGDPAGASMVFQQLYEQRRKSLGPTHLDTLRMMMNIGVCASRLKDNAEAERWYRDTLALMREAHPKHPELRRLLANLALVLRDEKRWDESIMLFRELLQLAQSAEGETVDLVYHARDYLAETLLNAGALDEAESIWRETLAATKLQPGKLETGLPAHFEKRLAEVAAARGEAVETQPAHAP